MRCAHRVLCSTRCRWLCCFVHITTVYHTLHAIKNTINMRILRLLWPRKTEYPTKPAVYLCREQDVGAAAAALNFNKQHTQKRRNWTCVVYCMTRMRSCCTRVLHAEAIMCINNMKIIRRRWEDHLYICWLGSKVRWASEPDTVAGVNDVIRVEQQSNIWCLSVCVCVFVRV